MTRGDRGPLPTPEGSKRIAGGRAQRTPPVHVPAGSWIPKGFQPTRSSPRHAGLQSLRDRLALGAGVRWFSLRSTTGYGLQSLRDKSGQRTERLFWQSGGGYDRNIITRRSLLSMIDTLHNNPVRKQWVLRARDWRWSSAAWYDDLSSVPLIPDRIPFDWLE